MAVKAIKVGPGKLTIGSDSLTSAFQSQVTACQLVPSVDNGDAITVLSGEQVAGDRSESWTLEITMLNDFGVTDSRIEWCFEHRGETHPFTFVPATAQTRQVVGDVVVEALPIGGEVNTKPQVEAKWIATNVDTGVVPGPPPGP